MPGSGKVGDTICVCFFVLNVTKTTIYRDKDDNPPTLMGPRVARILNDDQDVIAVRRDHDFVLLGPHPQKSQLVPFIQRPHYMVCLDGKLRHQRRVIFRVLIGQV